MYKDYLKSKQWKNKSYLNIKNHKSKCCKCGCTEGLHTHHGTYKNKYKETKNDLFVLCEGCHWEFHKLYGSKEDMMNSTSAFIKNKEKKSQLL